MDANRGHSLFLVPLSFLGGWACDCQPPYLFGVGTLLRPAGVKCRIPPVRDLCGLTRRIQPDTEEYSEPC
jgi:hypothetical protein